LEKEKKMEGKVKKRRYKVFTPHCLLASKHHKVAWENSVDVFCEQGSCTTNDKIVCWFKPGDWLDHPTTISFDGADHHHSQLMVRENLSTEKISLFDRVQ